MPLFDAIVLIVGVALIVGYFVHHKSYREGVEAGTDATLAVLEGEGLIVINDDGEVCAPRPSRRSRK